MSELVRKLFPILILLIIGFVVKRKNLFSEPFIEGLKVLIINIALPAVLFDAFSTMELQVSYLLLFVIIFMYCMLLYAMGYLLHRLFPGRFRWEKTKGYMTGFEFGMIGVGLFGAIWGMEHLWMIMLIAFGHELFIWFFYVLVISKADKEAIRPAETIKHFLTTPTIIAIVTGVVMNLTGIRAFLEGNIIGQSFLVAIEFLKPLTSPLILIIIGYTMTFHFTKLREIAVYLVARMILVLGIGTMVLFAIKQMIPGVDPLFTTAFYAFILLPAPYILPLYINDKSEAEFFTQLLLYSTIVSFIGYGILIVVNTI